MKKKPKTKKRGRVQKILRSPHPSIPEKAEIEIEDAEHLYREIRIENTLETEEGKEVKLKENVPVDVVIEADESATEPKDGTGAGRSQTDRPTEEKPTQAHIVAAVPLHFLCL